LGACADGRRQRKSQMARNKEKGKQPGEILSRSGRLLEGQLPGARDMFTSGRPRTRRAKKRGQKPALYDTRAPTDRRGILALRP